MRIQLLPILLLGFLAGCAADTDEDGLTDKEEAELGTDPEAADSDGDGLGDYEEHIELGTDPTKADTDGDGYDDGDEIAEGSDPVDEASWIYTGGWPYNGDKDALDGPDLAAAGNPVIGEKFARVQFVDQHGDTVDLYDLLGQGIPVAVDVSAEWCGPCNNLSGVVSGNDVGGWAQYWPNLKARIDDGSVRWVTMLGQDYNKKTPSVETLHGWDEKYPHPDVPVMASGEDFNAKYITIGWPSVYLLDADGVITMAPTDQNPWLSLDAVNDL